MSHAELSGAEHWVTAEMMLDWSDLPMEQLANPEQLLVVAVKALAHATLAASAASYGWHRPVPRKVETP